MEEQNRNPEEEKQGQQTQGMPVRSYILMIMAGVYLVYTGYKLCKNVIDGVDGGGWGFMAAGIGFLVVGVVMLIVGCKNLYKNDKEKKALEAAETEKNPEPVTEEKPEMKSMSIAERARLTENIEDEAEMQEESESSDKTEE